MWQEGDVFMIDGKPWTVVKVGYQERESSLDSITLVEGYFERDKRETDKWYRRRLWRKSAVQRLYSLKDSVPFDIGERTMNEIRIRKALSGVNDRNHDFY